VPGRGTDRQTQGSLYLLAVAAVLALVAAVVFRPRDVS
jgi:ABC-2 type transport system permease protein